MRRGSESIADNLFPHGDGSSKVSRPGERSDVRQTEGVTAGAVTRVEGAGRGEHEDRYRGFRLRRGGHRPGPTGPDRSRTSTGTNSLIASGAPRSFCGRSAARGARRWRELTGRAPGRRGAHRGAVGWVTTRSCSGPACGGRSGRPMIRRSSVWLRHRAESAAGDRLAG